MGQESLYGADVNGLYGRTTCPACGKSFDTEKGLQSHFGYIHPERHLTVERLRREYDEEPCDLLDRLHNEDLMSVNQMSSELGVSRGAVTAAMSFCDVDRRGRSEAERVKWSQMSEEERQQQVAAAHEKTKELWEDGGQGLQQWMEENPEKLIEHGRNVGAVGAELREKNGMAGVTGQDHPDWRGGASLYDAVRKQLRPSFNAARDDYRDDECRMCGTTAAEAGQSLDVHHIVPVLSGGTNEAWNFTTLCRPCHARVEWFTRGLLDPVLTE